MRWNGIVSNVTRLIIVAVVLCLAIPSPSRAEPTDTQNGEHGGKYMFLDEVRPGMKGYGLTVFSGTTIERFDVEILSILQNIGPDRDLILVRIAGGPIEKAGVIAGMSGSPVYIDDRIIGALAFAWPFATEPIAGITPIREMLDIFAIDQEIAGSASQLPKQSASTGWAHTAGISVPTATSDSAVMRPIMTPLVFSGFSPYAVEGFRSEFEQWGIVPVTGGSFSDDLAALDVPLEEGASIGVELISGDMSASAIGTLTVKDGERVLAFGHPFLLAGTTALPMTQGYIHAILPSLIVSTKMGSSLKPIGAITQDRDAGLGGVIGASAEMVPLSISVSRNTADAPKNCDVNIAPTPLLFASLASAVVSSALTESGTNTGPFSAKIHYDIESDGLPTISNDDFISGMSGLPWIASSRLRRDLGALTNNRFTEVSIRSVSVRAEVQEAVESATISGARIRKETLRPGEDVEMRIILKPYMKKEFERDIILSIPKHAPEGQLFLYISAAPETAAFDAQRAPLLLQPANIEQLVKIIDKDYPGNRLDITLLAADPGLVVDGEEMSAPPSSVLSVMSQTMGKDTLGTTRSSILTTQQVFFDFEVEGAVMIPITIDPKAH